MSAEQEMSKRSWLPWDEPGEWVLWLVALMIATLFIHNFTQWGKAHLLGGHDDRT